ncbi:syntaxin binding protein 5 [Vigna unguiculata]|uniref:Syntaxin binding protein 5 n=1 Tax=Vigna unguiculata TaxID=3917 RepID=A0A4D6MKP7_VIGUN|nr:syntaxin binding protein 5 [Vigna unguiculata]
MFSRLFNKLQAEQNPQDVVHPSANFDPQVVFHYGVPSTASILAFDHFQNLLAMGTLDGRIKVCGGDNIEGILISPKQAPFKNLEFLENQGFLASVSNDNEIQVWDLKSKQIASALQWESIITAFSVIYGTSYMYVGTEYGMVYVLMFDSEDRKIKILPYYVPTNVISEAAGMSLDQVSVVRVLHQPCSDGNRQDRNKLKVSLIDFLILLIAYENGLMVLWDASKDRIVLMRNHKDIKLKRKIVASYANGPRPQLSNDKLEHEEQEKEISSLSWASSDGSVVVVGYVDGDILFWDFSSADFPQDKQVKTLSNDVVKLQLLSADTRLPITVLYWLANNKGGKLFVYGGCEIGSEEVLTVLSIDWSGGLENLRCTGRFDVTLHGSFADMVLLCRDCHTEGASNVLSVLTSPGQLDIYGNDCLSSLMSQKEKKTSVPTVQYPIVVPTLEPHMTTARLDVVCQDVKPFKALFKILEAGKHHSIQNQKSIATKWPLTGGVPGLPFKENHPIIQIYIAGYQDGSVQIWDATYPALSLAYNIKSEVGDVKIGNASAPVSALGFCPDTLHLSVGDESGVVRLYALIRSSNTTSLHFVTENGTEVHDTHQGDGPNCKALFTLQKSAVYGLHFANHGRRLIVGYEHGQVAMLDISSSTVLFLTKTESNTSAVVSMNAIFSDSRSSNTQDSVSDISDNPGMGLVYVVTRDAHFVAIDAVTGNIVCSKTISPRVKSNAISMYIIDRSTSTLPAEKLSPNSPRKSDSAMQPNVQSENAQVKVETATTVENSYCGQILSNSLILLCYESELSIHTSNFVFEGSSNYFRKVDLVQRCCWTTIFKKNEKECVLALLYQRGNIELRSLPALEVLGEISLMSILRWNLEINMEKTICSSSNGKIILVNGNETACISLLKCENELWIPESFPCLHDEVLAAAVDATASLSQNQNERQGASGIFVNIAKNFKAGKADHNANQAVHTDRLENLKQLFSTPPFLKSSSSTVDNQDPFSLDIDDIQIDEVVVFSSPKKIHIDNRDKGKETDRPTLFEKGTDILKIFNDKGKATDRQKLFEDASTDSKPRARTTEEIKAKYRKTGTGDASAAAALARDKLLERQQKLQLLNERTEELQNGAQDFASMATELAKRMENRKWWQL